MARAMWKGVIRFESVQVPVNLHAAIEDTGIHFRLLHATDKTPIEQKLIHPVSEIAVPYAEAQRGYELDEQLVLLHPPELEKLEPKESRDIVVHRFLPIGAIDHPWYLRPYWLGPDKSESSYAALVAALEAADCEGFATWTMRREEYRGALRVRDGRLMLITLHSARDVLAPEDVQAEAKRASTGPERDMAIQLIETLSGEFDPKQWRDDYRDRVLELVRAKASGKVVQMPKFRPKPQPESLAEALAASVEAAKKGSAHGHREQARNSRAAHRTQDRPRSTSGRRQRTRG